MGKNNAAIYSFIRDVITNSPPILFVIFNRPDLTQRVFERIREAQPRQLFIAADGPRPTVRSDIELCIQTRHVVEQIDWVCDVHTLYQDVNLGCKKAVTTAFNWFFENVEAGIILEDDCLPALQFFNYCNELLERYKDNSKILSINGFNFGYRPSVSQSYSFSRYMNMWGWATWRRSARIIDYKLSDWGKKPKNYFLYTRLRSSIFDLDWKWVKRWRKTFDELIEKQVDTWDYYWMYRGFKDRLFSIVPHRNLIQNIGFDIGGTHTTNTDHPITKIEIDCMPFPLVHPTTVTRNVFYEENYVKKIWQLYYRRNFGYQLWAIYQDIFKSASQ